MSSFNTPTSPAFSPPTPDLSRDETATLIAASKVNGTSVYNPRGDSLGSIYDVMLDKGTGKVAFAIMSFGGFLGLGESYHPLPWSLLRYDPRQGGYIVNLDRDRLEGAPSYAAGSAPDWSNRAYGQGIDAYYGVSS
ncbi:MAG: PRC-barrel domain containing protein [Proteobacteria bacterium]|nr:PRC-barrel domain containing protein [Pseudomonadota bacterium]